MSGQFPEDELQKKIGYSFRDPALLRQALTHRSYANEPGGQGTPHNERLEFLGDAVLDLAVGQLIFQLPGGLSEGEMTRIRAEVVSEKGLARVSREFGLGEYLLLGRGEERTGGRGKNSLLADGLEALLGGVFRDGGYESACRVVETLFSPVIDLAAGRKQGLDHKTRLQEMMQGEWGRTPEYVLIKTEGPDHQPWYTVEVRFDDRVIGRGHGGTKKEAEQNAAGEALAEREN